MKILHIITRLSKGGSAENVLLTCEKINRNKFESVLIFGYSKMFDKKILNANYKTFCVTELVRNISPIKDISAFIKICKIIVREKPDIVHTHSSKAGILGRWAAYFSSKLKLQSSKIKIVHTPHGHIYYGYYGKIVTAIFIWIEKITAMITDKLIALTEGEKNESLKFGVGKEAQWTIIPSGVGIDFGFQITNYKLKEYREELNIKDNEIVIGTVARLEPIKGIKYFIEAIKIIADYKLQIIDFCKFLIVGDGAERKMLESRSEELNIKDKVIFTGIREDVCELISIMDIYIQPSINEGMGKTIVMASAFGKPVIATMVQGIPNVVKDNVTGILVESKNSKAIAEAIIKLVKDKNLREKYGYEGKKWINRIVDGYPQFSVEYMLNKLEKLYEKI